MRPNRKDKTAGMNRNYNKTGKKGRVRYLLYGSKEKAWKTVNNFAVFLHRIFLPEKGKDIFFKLLLFSDGELFKIRTQACPAIPVQDIFRGIHTMVIDRLPNGNA